ncbi:DUF1636 family protein [Parasedimentitalea huanghaiensis]|uniref:DUF1636 domain-containing protein n=1 Tax=Parasedimentitalea huanghaiensis TaxID=2682100 RepID=A0A6L6WJR2_9RHOB|nr:DUF1636 domain-containing protein [Zongyanglinia huanghaiensis]MVO18073.1 DUF1636 domain-containing protein [Zongyanglinia huanghaiensis]
MSRPNSHRITVCTSCRHTNDLCRSGYELIEQLRSAIAAAGNIVSEDFEISGTACMTGCNRLCTVAYHGSRKAAYLFGDIDPDQDIKDLVDYAREPAMQHSGWCSALDHSEKPLESSLLRVPSAVIALEESTELLS